MTLEHRNNSRLIWIIAAACVVIIAFVLLYFWMTSQSHLTESSPIVSAPTQTQPNEHTVMTPAQQNTPISEPAAIVESTQASIVDNQILTDQIPQDTSLAKDELAKLTEIQNQLNQQKNNLAAQHIDADRLIKLKEEQINLLEQQLSTQHKD